MANILKDIALPQETITVDDVEYLITAMTATKGLQFMERHQKSIDEGVMDLAIMREVIVSSVAKDNKQITEKSFDIIFSRKHGHLRKLYAEVLKYNFEDVFTELDTEDLE